jgi:hypothetical protein
MQNFSLIGLRTACEFAVEDYILNIGLMQFIKKLNPVFKRILMPLLSKLKGRGQKTSKETTHTTKLHSLGE